MIIEVAPALPVSHIFSYIVPAVLQEKIKPGVRVLVPFRSRTITAYTLDVRSSSEGRELKEVLDVLDEEPLFPHGLLALFEWMARYYHFPLGKVIENALPAGLNVMSKRYLVLTEEGRGLGDDGIDSSEMRTVLSLFDGDKSVAAATVERACPGHGRDLVRRLVRRGVLGWKDVIGRARTGVRKEPWTALTGKMPDVPLSDEDAALVAHLRAHGPIPLRMLRTCEAYRARVLKKLEKNGLVSSTMAPVCRDPLGVDDQWYTRPQGLTSEQTYAVRTIGSAISTKSFSPYVLHGVTGSGKTEVYLGAVERALALGRDSIVLVPEIALTAAVQGAFISRFGDRVAVLHSGLSPGEKLDQWMRIVEGEAHVAIGARSAVFAPFSSLGLIVVDEEHDSSYKQDEKLRYQGRDVAVMRAHLEKAVVVLGSATPSIQSMFNVQSGRYGCLSLTSRVEERSLPAVHVVDMRRSKKSSHVHPIFSREFLDAVGDCLRSGEQGLVFLNRRGFSPSMQCNACGHALTCPNCSVSLTHHSHDRVLLCHYCGYSIPALPACPKCRGTDVKHVGWGTERVETELKRLFPEARIMRMDRDTTSTKRGHQVILKAVRDREVDILVGTQMVTKGHDFPHITFVGVISADLTLNLPDFRAAEKTFQLLAQVSGRAGRGETPGRVIVQTYNPAHYSIVKAREHDYPGYYEQETTLRRALEYPPYVRLVVMLLESNVQASALRYAQQVMERASAFLGTNKAWQQGVKVLGPAPAPVFKIRGKFRYQVFLKGLSVEALHAFLNCVTADLEKEPPVAGVKLIVDVDPENML